MEILFGVLIAVVIIYLLIGAVLGFYSASNDPNSRGILNFLVLLFLWPLVMYKLRSWS